MTVESQSNVVTIYGEGCDPRRSVDDVVRVLEDALRRARSGEIVAVALAGINFDRSTARIYGGQAARSAMIGALHAMAHDLMHDERE